MSLHVAVVAVVVGSAILGGGRLFSQTQAGELQAAATSSQPTVNPAVQMASSPAPSPTALTDLDDSPAATRAEPEPSVEPNVVAQALSLPLSPDSSATAEEGVMVARAATSSRGGLRSIVPAPTPAPTVAPTPTPPPKKEALKPHVYTVVEGDTLLAIAYEAGITPESILWANDLGNGELLQIGQQLTIPPVSGVLHTVQKGDTLLSIAEAYGAKPEDVVDANALENSDQLQEGQLLVVPGGMMRTVSITGLPTAPSAQELEAAPKYKVKEGDTLLSIADAFGVRASVIQVANNLLNPDLLSVGEELAIPGGKQQAAAAPAPEPQPAAPAAKPAPKPAPAPEPEPAPAPASGDTGDRIAAIAQKYIGYRYLWGGHSPSGFDCSGFTWYVYKEAGVSIPIHDLWGQLNAGPRIARGDLLPGDLVFFQNTYKAGLSHTGIYLGGGRWINAEDESVGVQVRSLSDGFWAARYVGASRPW